MKLMRQGAVLNLERFVMSSMQKRYEEMVEQLRNVKIEPGLYQNKKRNNIKYEVISVDEESNSVLLRTVHSGNEMAKTLHWAKKNLESCS